MAIEVPVFTVLMVQWYYRERNHEGQHATQKRAPHCETEVHERWQTEVHERWRSIRRIPLSGCDKSPPFLPPSLQLMCDAKPIDPHPI